MNSKRLYHLAVATLLTFSYASFASAQVEAHIHHAFPDVCDGSIIIMGSGFDQVVWSTGDEGLELTAPPGDYGFSVYNNGNLVFAGVRTIESNGWEVQVQALPLFDGIQLSGTLGLQHCGTSIYNAPCCIPDPSQTTFEVFQDGEPYAPAQCTGCTEVQCAYSMVMVSGLPYGHVYTYAVNDPVCAGVLTAGMITAHSCANLQLDMEVVDAIGGNTGSIAVLEAVPDPTEPLPISAPVTGTFRLFNNAGGEPVGEVVEGGAAMWTDLAPGEYLVVFVPDELCQTRSNVVTVSGATSVGDRMIGDVDLYPRVADDFIALPTFDGKGSVNVRVLDMNGRSVLHLTNMPPSRIPVSALVPGAYVVMAASGEEVLHARFIRR